MQERSPAPLRQLEHGYPHLKVVKESIRLLYSGPGSDRVTSFARSCTPEPLPFPDFELLMHVQRVAGLYARHYGLPLGRVIVCFKNIEAPGRVELGNGDDYLIEIDERYQGRPFDIGAILAHEVTHVFLHVAGLEFKDELKNEILTDTACCYLGLGWPCLNAYRQTSRRVDKLFDHKTMVEETQLGYLTPEEFAYVMSRRSVAFDEEPYHFGGIARTIYEDAERLVRKEARHAPIAGAGLLGRLGYLCARLANKHVVAAASEEGSRAYRLEAKSRAVIVECPRCTQALRLPTRKALIAECPTCNSSSRWRT